MIFQAAFIPSPDGAHDTSYFASRYAWNSNEGNFEPDPHFDESDDESTSSGSTSDSDDRPEEAVRLESYRQCGQFDAKILENSKLLIR